MKTIPYMKIFRYRSSTKNFNYTKIADRLRTVRWSNNSHPTGVVNRFMSAQHSHYPQLESKRDGEKHLKMTIPIDLNTNTFDDANQANYFLTVFISGAAVV